MKRRDFMGMMGKGAGALALLPFIPKLKDDGPWTIGTWEFTSIKEAMDAAPCPLEGLYTINCDCAQKGSVYVTYTGDYDQTVRSIRYPG